MGCYHYICIYRFPTTFKLRRGIAVPRFVVLIREKVFEELERLEDIHGQKRFALTKFRFVALPFGRRHIDIYSEKDAT